MPTVYFEHEVQRLSEAEIREEVREGSLPATAEVEHPPWTGEGRARVAEVAELEEELAAVGARVRHAVDRAVVPRMTAWLVVLLGVVVAIQFLFGAAGLQLSSAELEDIAGIPLRAGVLTGVLDGGWWTPWTSFTVDQTTHLGLGTLLTIPVVVRCGAAIERSCGRRTLALVLVATQATASAATLFWSGPPTHGSLPLALGLAAAHAAGGLRHRSAGHILGKLAPGLGTALLAGGTLSLALVLGEATPALLGAAVAGGAAGMLLGPPPVSAARRARRARQEHVALGVLVLAPMAHLVALQHAPALFFGRISTTVDQVGSVETTQPWALAAWERSRYAATYNREWESEPRTHTGLYLATTGPHGWDRGTHETAELWAIRLADRAAKPLPDATPIGDGWRAASALVWTDADGLLRVDEHRTWMGDRVLFATIITDATERGEIRRRYYRRALARIRELPAAATDE